MQLLDSIWIKFAGKLVGKRANARSWLLCGAGGLIVLMAAACGGAADNPTPEPPATVAPLPVTIAVNIESLHVTATGEVTESPPADEDASTNPPAPAPTARPAPAASPTSTPSATTPQPTAAVSPESVPTAVPQGPSVEEAVAAQEALMVAIYQRALPSVVNIRVTQRMEGASSRLPGAPEDFLQQAEGTGFVWDDEGHIVTNNHVVEGADTVMVGFADRTEVEATVLGGDPDSDLAVLRMEGFDGTLTPAVLGDSSAVQVGHLAVAIGAPFGQQFTMTVGIISAVGRTMRSGDSPFTIPDVMQTDAAINPGNSGGPLLDRLGRVIGINTQIISRTGGNEGVGLAVPINIARMVVPAIIEDGQYDHAWLGVSGSSLDASLASILGFSDDTRGALILQVVEDGPAGRAGLRGSDQTETVDGVEYPSGGDLIVGIDGLEIRDMIDLITYLSNNSRPGDVVSFSIIRDGGERLELPVTLGTRPRPQE